MQDGRMVTDFVPYTVSWNLTQRCNQECAHCYLSAFPRADTKDELTTEECVRVVDEMAAVNPALLLILTGGEPFLRRDLFDLADRAVERGFTVVLGTNGFLLGEKQAQAMRQHGIQGASISLDSTDPARHDAFRQFPARTEKYDGNVPRVCIFLEPAADFKPVYPWHSDIQQDQFRRFNGDGSKGQFPSVGGTHLVSFRVQDGRQQRAGIALIIHNQDCHAFASTNLLLQFSSARRIGV
jgi:hypothetical protein